MDSPRSISSNTHCTDHEGDENFKWYTLNESKTDLKLSENENEVEFVRSIAMSKNIAYSVQDDVDQFIRINTLDRESLEHVCNTNESENFNMDKSNNLDLDHICETFEPPLAIPLNLKSLCSFILPPADDGIISAVVLSKWDDIMGPQTIYAWMCSNSQLEDEQALNSKSAEFESSEQVDSFVLDLCTMLMSVKNVGIISRAPSYCPQLFQHPVLLHDALTSHLQTAGCTLVMGTSFHDVNMTNASSDCSATITQVLSLPLANTAVFEGLASIMFK
uniref:Uncharacterized protein n=1 Tax=Timema bartmani TaxID=61472 RepID=A0A7R9ET37_9NEOP|nr:unnamed protein product [Timema bartmani]